MLDCCHDVLFFANAEHLALDVSAVSVLFIALLLI